MRDFKLSPTFLADYEGTQPGFGPLGYVTYKRTYSRKLEDGSTEEFWQTCQRVVEGVYSAQKRHVKNLGLPWNNEKAQRSAQEMFRRMWEFKWLPPGRGLWMMGTPYIERAGGAALNNCGFVSTRGIKDDPSRSFLLDDGHAHARCWRRV
jgi:ribonucleoside-triphosphate reductase